ncbi:unnamed protein product [Rotaria magnacalcarata]|uniref:Uncharacterized protein n=1 Tax=Rotaria magnacalcarata TaxID=392030 RepID=A0A816ED43_9BILA|nr:unnamed protein product [Rotaria magnacalcarata]
MSIYKYLNIYICIKCYNLDCTNELNHHDSIINMLNEWIQKNCHAMNMANSKLIENQDFQLAIVSNGSSPEASICCSCGVKVQLTRVRYKFSLSNFYKHIKSKNCIMMKKKKITSDDADEPNSLDEYELTDDTTSQAVSINELTQGSASSITIGHTVGTVKSLKRTYNIEQVAKKNVLGFKSFVKFVLVHLC